MTKGRSLGVAEVCWGFGEDTQGGGVFQFLKLKRKQLSPVSMQSQSFPFLNKPL